MGVISFVVSLCVGSTFLRTTMARNFVGFTYGEQRNFNSIFRTGLWVLWLVELGLAFVCVFCSDVSHEK